MDSLKYSDRLEKVSLCMDWLIAKLRAVTDIKKVSDQIGDLRDDRNLPIAIVFLDEASFDDGNGILRAVITVLLKSQAYTYRSNNSLVKKVGDVMEDFTMGRNCRKAEITYLSNDVDSLSASASAVKNFITRVEIQLEI